MNKKTKLLLLALLVTLNLNSWAQVGLDFDGSNDFVNCGTNPSTAITGNALTVEAWVRVGSFGTASTSNAVVNRIHNIFQDNDGYALSVGNNGVVTAEIGYGTTTFPYALQVSTASSAISLNTWTHIAMTFDGVILKIYVDGTVSTTAVADHPVTASNQPLAIGYRPQYNQSYFDGIIDEVRIWNTVRTQAEIMQSMNNGACLQNPVGLVAYYSFEQGTPQGGNGTQTSLIDDSGNGNTGTLTNFSLSGQSSNYVGGATNSSNVNIYLLESSCLTYTSPTGQVYTNSGVYYDTIPSASGCGDTVYTIYLTVGSGNSSASITEISCGDYTSNSGVTYTTSGVYTEQLQTVGGCDSTLTIDLTVLQSSSSAITGYGCSSYTSPSGNIYYAEGTYTDTVQNVAGCDSIITIDVLFTPVDTVVNQNEITLEVNTPAAAYQWVDCDNNYAPITGETGISFTATANGNYAVIITSPDNCVDTSACYAITTVGTDELSLLVGVNLYPNPSTGELILDLPQSFETIQVEIYGVNGQVFYAKQYNKQQRIELNKELDAGVYMVSLTTEKGNITLPWLIK